MIITTEQPVVLAKFKLRLESTSEHDAFLEKMVNSAASKLNATGTYTIQCHEAHIDCNQAKLPDNYDILVGFQFAGDGCSGCCGACTGGNALTAICECRSMYTYYQWDVISHRPCSWYGTYFSINGNFIHFPSTLTQDTIKIWYRGFNTDGNGLMILDEEQEECLACYAAYQFSVSYPESYTPKQMDTWLNGYKGQKAWLNGKAKIREFKLQKPYITKVVNAIMINKNSYGIGCV